MLTQEKASELGLGVGVGLDIDLGELKSAVNALNSALAQSGVAVADLATEAIRLVRKIGIDDLVMMVKEGSKEAAQLVGQLFTAMQKAAEKGVSEAGELLAAMGHKMEAAGMKMQPHTCSCKHSSGE